MKKFDALLELSPEKARELGHALVEHLLQYQARLATLPVVKVESTAALRSAIWEELPARGSDPLAVLERTFYLAEYAEKQLRARNNWEITSNAQMAVVTFRYVPQGQTNGSVESARRIDALNRAIATRMQEQGFALVLTTELRGQTVLRLCTINPRTTEEDISKTVEALEEHARKELSCGSVSE